MLQRVLVIDDDPLFQAVAEGLLRANGSEEIICASSGIEGLGHVKDTAGGFDLILCDLNMPGMDGVNVVRTLGELDYPGAFAIVSSEADEVIASVRMVAEMVGVRIVGGLSKPLREEALRELIAAVPKSSRNTSADLITRADLVNAMTSGVLMPVYQPQLCLDTTSVCGSEALLRLRNNANTLHSAVGFLEAAERHDLITPLTLQIFDQVIEDLLDWRRAGIMTGTSVNISPASLKERDLPDALSSRVRGAGLKPNSITLEITENRLLDFDADTLEVLARLRIAGFGLSVDDFGTGATSIEQLRRFPFTELKLDKSFVQCTETDEFARETLATSVRLSRLLKLAMVAEGVETAGQLRMVRDAGIRKAQGYLIAKPMPSADFIAWMDGRTKTAETNSRVA